ncbi:MAG: hypothetical protein WBG08_01015 [Litorimonas sp.]
MMKSVFAGLAVCLGLSLAGPVWAAPPALAGAAPSKSAPAKAPSIADAPMKAPEVEPYEMLSPEIETAQAQPVLNATGEPVGVLFQAAPPPMPVLNSPVAHIEAIEFRGGRFVQESPGQWAETRNDGKVNYRFYQTAASEDVIELTGPQGMVRLFVDLKDKVVRGQWPGQTLKTVYTITDVKTRAKPQPPTPQPPVTQTPVTQPAAPQPPVTQPPNTDLPLPRDLQIATYKSGQFLKTGDKSWQQTTEDGQVFTYDQIGFDEVSVFLFDPVSKVMISLEPQRLLARMTGADHYLQPFTSLLSASAAPLTPAPAPEDGRLSEAERSTCLKTGGTVERAGILGAERCTRPYGDAGMACLDSAQCQGQCRTDVGTAAGTPVTGVCQANDNPFGCFSEVVAGRAGPGLCID